MFGFLLVSTIKECLGYTEEAGRDALPPKQKSLNHITKSALLQASPYPNVGNLIRNIKQRFKVYFQKNERCASDVFYPDFQLNPLRATPIEKVERVVTSLLTPLPKAVLQSPVTKPMFYIPDDDSEDDDEGSGFSQKLTPGNDGGIVPVITEQEKRRLAHLAFEGPTSYK